MLHPFILGGLLAFSTGNPAPTTHVDGTIALAVSSTHAAVVPQQERQMLADVNAARRASGLAQLASDPRLAAVAREHARDMVDRKYFGHVSPDGISPFDRLHNASYAYRYAGENIAYDYDEPSAQRGLWDSPGHRKNMLETHYTRVGIGAIGTAENGIVYVQIFSD